jgi:quercetin dioxygenase-like cupin family protein
MSDTTIKKVEAASSPRGDGSKISRCRKTGVLATLGFGARTRSGTSHQPRLRNVGYVISGRATLDLEGQTLNLKDGDSWLVPAGAMHQYKILERFTAVEATSPPAEVHGRDKSC